MSSIETALEYGRYQPLLCLDDISSSKQRKLIYNLFYKLFDVVHADTKELKDEAHRIRYQVFCNEHDHYENPESHPDGLESDPYDKRAEHALLMYKPLDLAIGTVRVIRHDEGNWQKSFPLQGICDSHYLHDYTYVKNACEFSRLCISSERRLIMKKHMRAGPGGTPLDTKIHFYEKPFLNIVLALAPLGLIRGAFELAMKHEILNIFGVMEAVNISRLVQTGLVYEEIGPEMEYHGKRVPFICNILETFDKSMNAYQDPWQIVTVEGKNHYRALEIYEKQSSSCFRIN
ncbi:MAG: PEP-CTERM/exosortase system-associated acyltransferase [Alphaproteobacteria bacterium]|nr:PEP-CTERM/exosortase system-associated acyltransferase [Alphaproteobacteria bacterium]